MKVLRAVHPERPGPRARGRYIHYDHAVGGGQDMLTSWLPLMEIPVQLGGLFYSQAASTGLLSRSARSAHLSQAGPRPTTSPVTCSPTAHPNAVLPNTGSALRISGDFRWQLPDHPAPSELILGPAGRGWEVFSRLVP